MNIFVIQKHQFIVNVCLCVIPFKLNLELYFTFHKLLAYFSETNLSQVIVNIKKHNCAHCC